MVHVPGLALAEYYCPPEDARWRCENRIGTLHVLAFPGTSVGITHADRRLVVADPNHVMFYNAGQIYRRTLISERGDRCIFVAFGSTVALELLDGLDPSVADRPERPFRLDHGPSDAASYLRARVVFDELSTSPRPDVLRAQEVTLTMLRALVARAYRGRPGRSSPRRTRTMEVHTDAVQAMKLVLSRRFREPLTLHDLAAEVDVSPFHLARIFRQHTGVPLHGYRNQLRLRSSLEALADPRIDLTALALDLGYSSHSHFTDAFRRAFGLPPSAVRTSVSPRRLREMSKILEA